MTDRKTCPFQVNGQSCQRPIQASADSVDRVECDACKGCQIDSRLVRAPTTLNDWTEALGAVRELNEKGFPFPKLTWGDDYSAVVSSSDGMMTVSRFPSTIEERASHLLELLVQATRRFGQEREIVCALDHPLAYAEDEAELIAYLDYLTSLGYIEKRKSNRDNCSFVKVTALGHQASATRLIGGGLRVFISSTCFDLHDCRAELTDYLSSLGCEVIVSDNPELFDVDSSSHSIDSCLHNLGRSDLVLCLIDRRYGSTLEKFGHPEKSASHVEVEFAQTNGIPIYYFIRKMAFSEYGQMKRSKQPAQQKTAWVETENPEQRERWVKFVSDIVRPSLKNNWVDQFDSVVDLKRMVKRRIQATPRRRGESY